MSLLDEFPLDEFNEAMTNLMAKIEKESYLEKAELPLGDPLVNFGLDGELNTDDGLTELLDKQKLF